MPNWCQNIVTFKHEDAAQVTRLIEAFDAGRLLNEFVPCPKELHEETPVGEDYAARDAARAAENTEKFGYASWYDWQVAHWGTKWDVDGEEGNADLTTPTSAKLYFDSAWSPPISFYEAMHDMGWDITAYYFEPGMNYCGIFEEGEDECIEIQGDSAWVRENVPEDLDDAFDIAGMLEEYETETEQEEDGSD